MNLNEFCLEIMDNEPDRARLDPDSAAAEFVRFYSLPKIISLERLKKLTKFLGIKKIYPDELPKAYRGYHFGSNGKYEIQYRKEDWVGSIEHTVLHEIYEIIEETCDDLSTGFEKRKGKLLEMAANAFAAAVLMQTEHFLSDVYRLSLDVLKLQQEYGRAYLSIILRMKRVLNNRHSFFAVIYGPVNPNQVYVNEFGIITHQTQLLQNYLCTHLVKTSDIKTNRKRGRLLWGLLPRKKDHVLLDSVVRYVLTEQRSVYRDKVGGFDMFGYDDLSIIARPVFWNQQISKVVMVGISRKDNRLLGSQFERVDPLILDETFQII